MMSIGRALGEIISRVQPKHEEQRQHLWAVRRLGRVWSLWLHRSRAIVHHTRRLRWSMTWSMAVPLVALRALAMVHVARVAVA